MHRVAFKSHPPKGNWIANERQRIHPHRQTYHARRGLYNRLQGRTSYVYQVSQRTRSTKEIKYVRYMRRSRENTLRIPASSWSKKPRNKNPSHIHTCTLLVQAPRHSKGDLGSTRITPDWCRNGGWVEITKAKRKMQEPKSCRCSFPSSACFQNEVAQNPQGKQQMRKWKKTPDKTSAPASDSRCPFFNP